MDHSSISQHIVAWLKQYASKAKVEGFVVGISGGIDSALTSTLCAETGLKVIALSMPLRQHTAELKRAHAHQEWLQARYKNVESLEIDLTDSFDVFSKRLPSNCASHGLSMANTRSRMRMMTLYSIAQPNGLLVAGTGNKIEDFGIGFFTKYGDGGVDVSPIADLTKTQVFQLSQYLKVIPDILEAAPTDGLWEEERTDEDQIGASYEELEWAMDFEGEQDQLNERQREVLNIYHGFHNRNKHKMEPIPVCQIPQEFFH